MKRTYQIEVDCANCANKMEAAAAKVAGVRSVSISFMLLKMTVEFEDGAEVDATMNAVRAACRRVESDCEIYF